MMERLKQVDGKLLIQSCGGQQPFKLACLNIVTSGLTFPDPRVIVILKDR